MRLEITEKTTQLLTLMAFKDLTGLFDCHHPQRELLTKVFKEFTELKVEDAQSFCLFAENEHYQVKIFFNNYESMIRTGFNLTVCLKPEDPIADIKHLAYEEVPKYESHLEEDSKKKKKPYYHKNRPF